ncbi:hypothetical protein BGZ89_008706, partial [Linnemannia elongata]
NLVNIPFNASTALSGLQSLANPAPSISALQVVSGTTTELTMAITVIIVNPSSISLSAGDIVLSLVYKGVALGTVTMPNLAIVPGANTIQASSSINPAASPEGMELLTLYTSGAGATVSIVGTPTSTAVESLNLAFGALNIETQMPGLPTKLLGGASLVVLDTTLVDGLAQTVVTVNNPFVPPMTILSIDSKITYNGVALGTVVSTFGTPPVIPGVGAGTITAPLLMNTNAHDLVTLIRAQAVANGLNTAAFDGLLALQAGGNPSPDLFVGFNVADFVTKAMAGLVVDITMTTTVKVGDYQVTMPYTQTGVPTGTDQTILKLIPVVGTPIAQILVNGSALAFDAITLNAPTETSFSTDIVGAITKTGPLDAEIVFPNPLTVSFNGKALGNMAMPTVKAIANQGATLNLFEWTITTTGIVVNAMGVSLPGVSMTKTVTLDGFNKLPGLQLLNYVISAIDSAGMHMVISASLSNPSTIGMTIPVSQFDTQFAGHTLGPAFAYNMALVPHSNSSFALNATIAADGTDKTPYIKGIFHNALTGVATPLQAKGVAAPGVSWLDAAIKSLVLNTALPPLQEPPIAAVAINSMEMDFACATCVWAPTALSSITADTKLPFSMDVPIKRLAQNVQILDENGQLVGTLNTPYSDATTVGSKVSTNTPAAPLVVADGSHDIYTAFVGALNLATNYTLGLRGSADSMLDLGPFGLLEIKGIPIDVKTSMAGLQGLKNIEFNSLVEIYTNFNAGFTFVTTVVNIHNPSQLTLNIGTLGMAAGYKGYEDENRIGYTEIYNLRLVPGDNIVPSLLGQGFFAPNAGPFADDLTKLSPTMTLWANSTATSNPALNAGLSTLRTSLVLPQNLIVPNPPPPAYSNVWTVKILDNTVNDGIIEMSTTFSNSFLYDFSVTGDATKADNDFAFDPSFLTVQAPGYNAFSPFRFTNDLQYTLKKGESKTITFKMSLQKVGPEAFMLKFLEGIIPAAAAGPLKSLAVTWSPKVSVPGYPVGMAPDMSSTIFYPETGGLLTLQTGPDFAKIKDWYYKEYNYTNTTTSVAPPPPATATATATETATETTTTIITPTTPSVAPSPTPSPEVTTPPVAPAA